jgi:hypothetical protein
MGEFLIGAFTFSFRTDRFIPFHAALITTMGYEKTAIFSLAIILLSLLAGLTY